MMKSLIGSEALYSLGKTPSRMPPCGVARLVGEGVDEVALTVVVSTVGTVVAVAMSISISGSHFLSPLYYPTHGVHCKIDAMQWIYIYYAFLDDLNSLASTEQTPATINISVVLLRDKPKDHNGRSVSIDGGRQRVVARQS